MQTERGKCTAQRNADFLVSYMAKAGAELKATTYEIRDEGGHPDVCYASVTPAAET